MPPINPLFQFLIIGKTKIKSPGKERLYIIKSVRAVKNGLPFINVLIVITVIHQKRIIRKIRYVTDISALNIDGDIKNIRAFAFSIPSDIKVLCQIIPFIVMMLMAVAILSMLAIPHIARQVLSAGLQS